MCTSDFDNQPQSDYLKSRDGGPLSTKSSSKWYNGPNPRHSTTRSDSVGRQSQRNNDTTVQGMGLIECPYKIVEIVQ